MNLYDGKWGIVFYSRKELYYVKRALNTLDMKMFKVYRKENIIDNFSEKLRSFVEK